MAQPDGELGNSVGSVPGVYHMAVMEWRQYVERNPLGGIVATKNKGRGRQETGVCTKPPV